MQIVGIDRFAYVVVHATFETVIDVFFEYIGGHGYDGDRFGFFAI